jgi:3-phosphoshikimate 1-carboxyvinyltransferase
MSRDPQAGDHAGGTSADWLVPRAHGPVRALVKLPGSKSMTNRALVLAALSGSRTTVVGPLAARDTKLMAEALRTLGWRIEESADAWHVEPAGAHGRRSAEIDVGNAGTVLRFLPAVAALTDMDVTFRGDSRVAERPIAPLLAALAKLDVQISFPSGGTFPFVVHGRGSVHGGAVTLDASSSSQLISGLLLSAPRFEVGAVVGHAGPALPSLPHIEMTMAMLRACGVDAVTAEGSDPAPQQMTSAATTPADRTRTGGGQSLRYGWQVPPGPIVANEIFIEPDLSNAVPFLAAALATGGEVTVADWPADSLQPAPRIIEVLTAMGADVRLTPEGLRVSGSGRISGIGADLSAVGELTPVLTALATLASSPSEFTGIGHLRRHESDRLAALATEIGKLGGEVTELADGLAIKPRPLRGDGVVFDSHDDHRLVMAAAVLGLVTGGLRVRNAATVGKTFPEFSTYWARTLAPAG